METQLVIQAVLMTLWQKNDHTAVILHSDRGSQYTSNEYRHFLKDYNDTSSMSAVGRHYENAAAESFFGLPKREQISRCHYVTRSEARADILDYIEQLYDRRKPRKC